MSDLVQTKSIIGDQVVLELTVRGKKINVGVSRYGTFEATLNGKHYGRDTLDQLRTDLVKATKAAKAKMAIPFTKKGNDFRDLVCHGFHAKTGYLIVVETERGNTIDQWSYGGEALHPLSKDEKNTYRGLLNDSNAAQKAVYEFEQARKFDLGSEVRRIIAEAVAKEDE